MTSAQSQAQSAAGEVTAPNLFGEDGKGAVTTTSPVGAAADGGVETAESAGGTAPTGQNFAFTVRGVPKPKGSLRCLGKGRHIEQVNNTEWRNQVTAGAIKARQGREPLPGPVEVNVWFLLPKPKRTKRRLPTVRGMDIDKGCRLILDALQTARVYRDDAQVVALRASKTYGDPRAVIYVHEVPDA